MNYVSDKKKMTSNNGRKREFYKIMSGKHGNRLVITAICDIESTLLLFNGTMINVVGSFF